MKKVLNITLWVLVLAGLSVLVGFIESEHKKISCKGLETSIDYRGAEPLISIDEINKTIYDRFDTLIGKKLRDINMVELENQINEIDFIENAEVYTTLTGMMKIKVVQRNPLLRIQNAKNESFYIDQSGRLMPINLGHSSRELVASGNIKDSWNDTTNVVLLEEDATLNKLYKLASYIDQDEFLKAQVEQIYVTKEKEFELIPKVGRHLIVFGDIDNMEDKFDKLIIFYQEGMKKAGWNTYKTINLKYKDQVVCAKK